MKEAGELKRRQRAGAEVERLMIQFLMQYNPARELKVSEVQQIAASARLYAFDEYSPDALAMPLPE